MIPAAARRYLVAIAACASLTLPLRAAADEAGNLAAAKELFRQGLALLDTGDCEHALDYFARSRVLVPGKGNIANSAVCLERLGRHDEALEVYEDYVTRFALEISEQDKATVGLAMTGLRKKVGSVMVSSNVDGSVVIDGRARGKLPLSTSLRVIAGRHVLRVQKDGYATRESTFVVGAGGSTTLDLVLKPLEQAGQLRIEDPRNEGATVFVDGVSVGVVPWEGTLGPGEHVVWTKRDGEGSAPTRVTVVQGQTALVRVKSGPLGPTARLVVEPPSAEIAVNGVTLGAAAWEGELPVGQYTVVATEAGYVTGTAVLNQPPFSAAPVRLTLRLEIDPLHPRWPKPQSGHLWAGVVGGLPLSPGLGSQAEEGCGEGCSRPIATGLLVGLRAGYRFPFRLSVEISGGFLGVGSSFSRKLRPSEQDGGGVADVTYHLNDQVGLRGPWLAPGLSYRLPAGPRLGFLARVSVGAMFASSTDPITGTAVRSGETTPLGVTERDEVLTSTPVFVMPELGFDAALGPIDLGLSLGVAFFPSPGPAFKHAQVGVSPSGCGQATPNAVACTANSDVVAGERAYGSFVLFVPQLTAAHTF